MDESGIKDFVGQWASETIFLKGITILDAKSIAHSFGLWLLEHGYIVDGRPPSYFKGGK